MLTRDAKQIARQWVADEASKLPGFSGALFHGSILTQPDDAPFPDTSDVDILVVFSTPEPPAKIGKFRYRGVLLEPSALSDRLLQSSEDVLVNYPIAPSFRFPGVIADPTGRLTALQAAIAENFAKRPWVEKRCEQARLKVLNFLDGLKDSAPFHEQVAPWLFAAGVTTHILLVAGLKNPTVRRRYLDTKRLLAEYGRSDFYEPLLELLGCAEMTPERATEHLAALAEAFDAACTVLKTPYAFAADMTETARPVAIDGSRDLIEQGFHREAVFWMVAVYSRSLWVLYHDAPEDVRERHSKGYRRLLADLGIGSFADLRERAEAIRDFLPAVWEVAQEIIAANPAIEDRTDD